MFGSKQGVNIKAIVSLMGFILLITLILSYWKDFFTIFMHKDKLENWINSFGAWRYLIFIFLQFIQVVIFVIPGEVVHVAGGYLFGAPIASILSMVGILLGSILCFVFTRIVGQPLIEMFMSRKDIDKLKQKISNRRVAISLFIIFIIPGLPGKDAFAYIAGLTPIKFADFLIVSAVARAPWVIAASFWGSNLEKGNYQALTVITVVSVVFFILGIWKGEKILEYVSSRKNK